MTPEKIKPRWVFRGASSEEKVAVPDFFNLNNIPEGTARIMMRRGISTEEKLTHFLYDTLDNLSDPFLMKGMQQAVGRIIQAIDLKEKIVIYGDYDVDGITSTSICVRCLRKLGADVNFYIPLREEEGYGLNRDAINKLSEEGVSLLITVDCGISSADLVVEAPQSLDIIITDHHQPPKVLPDCVAVLNPHQEDCPYPYKELAGCGVAFTLCRGIYKELYNEDYKENIELVALGTIADVVSLTGENRILVKEGMARFLLTPIKGLSALLRITGLVNEDTKEILHADYISFGLAPRLNAAGRITHAKYGVELMTTESGEEAEALAQILCDTNIERQHIEREIYEEALQRIAELQIQDDLVLVIDGKDWHPGVIGIVASRILELYHRPVLVITVRNGVGKGSCRSISAFNIHEALEKMAGFLIQYGGHKMAAGFSIPAERISQFRKRINDYAKGIITVDDRIPVLELEESLPLDEVNIEFIRSLDLLEPYGSDNPKPLFASFRVFVETARRIGNDRKHFKCRLSQNREPVEAIFWGIGDKDPCCPGDIVDIVYEPEIHDWYGEHVQLICKDIRPVKDYFLTRDFLIDVFVRLRELIPNSKSVAVFEIQNRLKWSFEGKYSRQCLCTALSVFEELNILYRFNRNGVGYYQRKVINKKLDLLSSSIYRKYRK